MHQNSNKETLWNQILLQEETKEFEFYSRRNTDLDEIKINLSKYRFNLSTKQVCTLISCLTSLQRHITTNQGQWRQQIHKNKYHVQFIDDCNGISVYPKSWTHPECHLLLIPHLPPAWISNKEVLCKEIACYPDTYLLTMFLKHGMGKKSQGWETIS